MLQRFLSLALVFLAESLQASYLASPQGTISFLNCDPRDTLPLRRIVEDAEKTFHQLTGYEPGEAPPVFLEMRGKGSPAVLSVNALEGGGPEIRLVLPLDPEDPQLPQFLSSALLLRQYYGKTAPVPGSSVPRYPDWLSHGLGALILKRPTSDATISSTPELESFLTERVPDAANISLVRQYDAVAGVLLRSGLSDVQGQKAFRSWIGCYDPSAPAVKTPPWIEGWEMHAVERRWVLGLQAPTNREQPAISIRSAASTLDEYKRIVKEELADKDSFAEVAKDRGGAYRLQKASEKLAALRLQANPLALPIVEQTLQLVAKAKKTSPKKIRREEDRIRSVYLSLLRQNRAIEDYLDWYEAAKVPVPSGLFAPYLSLPAATVGKGPIGKHLDAVESRGW